MKRDWRRFEPEIRSARGASPGDARDALRVERAYEATIRSLRRQRMRQTVASYALSLACAALIGIAVFSIRELQSYRESDDSWRGRAERSAAKVKELEAQLAAKTREAEEIVDEARQLLREPARSEAETALEGVGEDGAEDAAESDPPAADLRGLSLNAEYAADDLKARIGEDALALILGHEITSRAVYELFHRAPQAPSNNSGVTIGVGYDLAWRKESEFRADWAGLGAKTVDLLASAVGKKGAEAEAVYPSVKGVAISYEMAKKVFLERSLVDAAATTETLFPTARLLPPESYGALVSLVMNRGYALESTDEAETRREMKTIAALLEAGRYDLVPEQLRAMRWLWWRGGDAVTGLVRRREEEAALFELGLRRLAERRAESLP